MLIEWLIFMLVMALGQIAPGPDMVLLTRTALSDGRSAGWAMAAGVASGLMIHGALALTGVTLLFSTGGWLTAAITLLAAVYLLWLAWQLFCSAKKAEVVDVARLGDHGNRTLWQYWLKGFLCNLLNPKVVVFLGAVMAPFLAKNTKDWWPWILWLTVWLEGFLLWALWVSVLQSRGVRRRYAAISHLTDRVFAVALCVIAGMLLWSLFPY